MSYIFWKLCDQGRSWPWKNDVRSWFEAARNFFFTPDSNRTLIWHRLIGCKIVHKDAQKNKAKLTQTGARGNSGNHAWVTPHSCIDEHGRYSIHTLSYFSCPGQNNLTPKIHTTSLVSNRKPDGFLILGKIYHMQNKVDLWCTTRWIEDWRQKNMAHHRAKF